MGDFSNWCVHFLVLTGLSTVLAYAAGGILAFLVIQWENRFLEHFLKPILFCILIALIGAGLRSHRPGAYASFAAPSTATFIGPN